MHMEISLSKGYKATVDDGSKYLLNFKWHILPRGSKLRPAIYAVHSQYRPGKNPKLIYMHRMIIEHHIHRKLLKSEEIDHINHDSLDNRITNLRIATHQQNAFNRQRNNKKTSSKYGRVTWDKQNLKWRARLVINGKRICIGRFVNEEDAARAIDQAAIQYHGEYACLNLPPKTF